MQLFERYIFRNLAIATALVSVTLVMVVFLSQSLQFLELVLDAKASSLSFWILSFLAMPRFFEIIVPLAMMAATIFIYNRMTMDSELVAIRSAGYSPLKLARPALVFAGIITVVLWATTMWIAPKTLSSMFQMRQEIKSQFSVLMFREGVFNQAGRGFTVYIRERDNQGMLHGVMIYDGRKSAKHPSTVLAKRGALIASETGEQVVVYDGSRQEYDPKTGKFQRLNFEKYTVDLPDVAPVSQHWREPAERSIQELFNLNEADKRDTANAHEFRLEIHRRLTAPLLALSFTIISCAGLLLGTLDRRGQGWKIAFCIVAGALLQGGYVASYSLAKNSDWALPLMYIIVIAPLLIGYALLNGYAERLERRFPGWARAFT